MGPSLQCQHEVENNVHMKTDNEKRNELKDGKRTSLKTSWEQGPSDIKYLSAPFAPSWKTGNDRNTLKTDQKHLRHIHRHLYALPMICQL